MVVFLRPLEHLLGGLHKTILFLQSWRFGRLRSSKFIDFGANRKRVCDFLLVLHNNLSPILLLFRDSAGFLLRNWPHPYSTVILEVFPLNRSPMLGSARAEALSFYSAVKLFSTNSNLYDHSRLLSYGLLSYGLLSGYQSQYLNVTDGQTALCVASRGKKLAMLNFKTRSTLTPTYLSCRHVTSRTCLVTLPSSDAPPTDVPFGRTRR